MQLATQNQMDNGKHGMQRIERTATGFIMPAIHIGNTDGNAPRVNLEIRRIVGDDGYPYIELEMFGLYEHERSQALDNLKQLLTDGGFVETNEFYDHRAVSFFGEVSPKNAGAVSIRAGGFVTQDELTKTGLRPINVLAMRVINALGKSKIH